VSWQLQDAKQQFSRLVERARTDGPQVVTRNGKEVAVVLGVEDYRRLGDAAIKRYSPKAQPSTRSTSPSERYRACGALVTSSTRTSSRAPEAEGQSRRFELV
jgi:prevent-host-death family protein